MSISKSSVNVLFRSKGRVNRLKFLLTYIMLWACVFVFFVVPAVYLFSLIGLLVKSGVNILITYIFFLMFCFIAVLIHIHLFFMLVVKRLHDLNRSGFYSLLLFVPLINIILAIILFFKKGTIGSNNYGEDPLLTDV